MPDNKNTAMMEDLFQDLAGFPKRFQNNSQAISAAFKHPEFGITMQRTDRNALLETLTGVMGTREGLIATLESVRYCDIVQTILDVVKNDAFYTEAEHMFEVRYDEKEESESNTQKKVNKMIESFVREIQLEPLINNILEDFLLYGEYPLRVVLSPNKGVLQVKDDLDPATTVGIYEIERPLFFLEKSSRGYTIRDQKDVVHFSLSATKIRIKTLSLMDEKKILPEYIRIGKSILYPALQKIRHLQTIELASLITDLKKAIAPILIAVSVPAGSLPEDVTEIAKKYEQHLQEVYRGLPDINNPSMGDLLSTVTNFRVIPAFTDGKGTVQTLDLIGNQADIDARIDRMRQCIAIAIGMPPYYLVPSIMENTQQKTDMLKLHSRYSRMLAGIQRAVGLGIRRIVALHIINRGIFIDENMIRVKFKALLNVEHLDQMEYSVAAAQTLRDVWSVIAEILQSDEVQAELDSQVFVDVVNEFLPLGKESGKPLLKYVKNKQMPGGEPGMPGGGGGGGGGGSLGGMTGGGGEPGIGEEPPVTEAPMYNPEEGGEYEGTEMANTEGIEAADFGEQNPEGEAGEEGAEGLPPEEAPEPQGQSVGAEGGVEAEEEGPELPRGSNMTGEE